MSKFRTAEDVIRHVESLSPEQAGVFVAKIICELSGAVSRLQAESERLRAWIKEQPNPYLLEGRPELAPDWDAERTALLGEIE